MAAWNSFSAGVVSGTVIWVRSMLESSVVNESRVVDVVVDVGVVVVRLGVEFLLANDDFDDDDDDDDEFDEDFVHDPTKPRPDERRGRKKVVKPRTLNSDEL